MVPGGPGAGQPSPTSPRRSGTEATLARRIPVPWRTKGQAMSREHFPELEQSMERRRFLKSAAAGTVLAALGGTYVLAAENDPRAKQQRPDGRLRLPPGQRLL